MGTSDRRASVTMEDVAARAGVSRALVSIVVRGVPGASPVTRERVLRAAAELDYRPDQRARLLGRSRSRTIGVVYGLHAAFHAELVEELYRAVEGGDYELALGAAAPSRPEARAVRALLDYRCEALVLLGPALPRAAIEELAGRVPVVVVARALRCRTVDVVRTDDVAGARLAVEHLLSLGHEHIAHVDGGRAPGAAERRRGYRTAMAQAGLGERVRLLPGGLTEASGEHAVAALPLRSRPSAITAFNDICAVGALGAARARGLRVPGDLSVVGYDDSQVAALATVDLTTVAQDAATLATSALDRARARLEDPPGAPGREAVVPPRLVVRGTTAPPVGDRRVGSTSRCSTSQCSTSQCSTSQCSTSVSVKAYLEPR